MTKNLSSAAIEERRAYQRERYRQNKKAILAKRKARYAQNKEASRAYQREYYKNNKERILKKQQEYWERKAQDKKEGPHEQA